MPRAAGSPGAILMECFARRPQLSPELILTPSMVASIVRDFFLLLLSLLLLLLRLLLLPLSLDAAAYIAAALKFKVCFEAVFLNGSEIKVTSRLEPAVCQGRARRYATTPQLLLSPHAARILIACFFSCCCFCLAATVLTQGFRSEPARSSPCCCG